MRSIHELSRHVACTFIGAVALGFAATALTQTAAPPAAPAASQGAEPAEAAESPRRARERRRAQDAAAAPAPAEKTAGPELVCKSVKPSGTRLPQRVCQTQEQWDSLTDASQEDMRRVRDRSRASGAQPN